MQAVEAVVTFYQSALEQANQALTDGTNQRPHYSLRTLCRALETARAMCGVYGYQRSLYEGVCAAFLTALSRDSYARMQLTVHRHMGEALSAAQLAQAPPCPGSGTPQCSAVQQGLGACTQRSGAAGVNAPVPQLQRTNGGCLSSSGWSWGRTRRRPRTRRRGSC
jgi:hypothetical protein